jgi:hypothetical protein
LNNRPDKQLDVAAAYGRERKANECGEANTVPGSDAIVGEISVSEKQRYDRTGIRLRQRSWICDAWCPTSQTFFKRAILASAEFAIIAKAFEFQDVGRAVAVLERRRYPSVLRYRVYEYCAAVEVKRRSNAVEGIWRSN